MKLRILGYTNIYLLTFVFLFNINLNSQEEEQVFEEEDIIRIRAIIYVLRESQRGIIIGHKGQGIKRIGTEARRDLEKFLGKKIFLETPVKVKKNWRDDDRQLKKFGYE